MKQLTLLLICILISSALSGCLSGQGPNTSSASLQKDNVGIAIPGSDVAAQTYSIDKPGMYYLTATRLCKSTGIDVNAHDVTIDLMGHALIGPGKDSGQTYGIRTNNYQNLEVCNGTIRDFGNRGIVDRGKKQPTGYKRIINMRVLNNGGCGICIGGPANLIKDCTCANNAVSGICPGYRGRIVGCLCHANEHIGIHSGRGCIVTQNTVSENGQSGIFSFCGSLVTDNCLYMNNYSEDPNHAGIVAMNGCSIKDNVLRDNHINNILVTGTGNAIQNNLITALHHPANPISLSSDDNVCINNQIHGSKITPSD